MSESDFKNGLQRLLGEGGRFKDWGGEQSDLLLPTWSSGAASCRPWRSRVPSVPVAFRLKKKR